MAGSDKRRPLGAAGFRAATDVSRETMARLETYAALLARWQRRINLVSGASLGDLWRRHFLDSAQLAGHIPPGSRILTDLGSGAGFPGLVLAILTGLECHLVEADARKAAFLREAARQTDTPARIHNDRIESLAPWATDVVTARALAPLPRLIEYASIFPARDPALGTIFLFLKGRDHEEELTAAQEMWHMRNEAIRSKTDPSGRILRIWDIKKRANSPPHGKQV